MARDLVAEREYQHSLDMLRILAQRDFVAWWEQAHRLGVLGRQKQAVEMLHAIASRYGEQAAYAAADYLFRSRQLDDLLARLEYPEVADPVGLEQAEASFGWALNTSRKEGVLDVPLAKRKLSGVLNRLILQPARETVAKATTVAGTRFARVPQPGACSFCLMLASRGDVYSENTVLQRSRGGSYHDNCSCLAIEVQTRADLPVINRQLEKLWADSTVGVSGSLAQRDAFAAAVQQRRSEVSERSNSARKKHMESVKAVHKFTVAKAVNESRSLSGEEAELRRKLGTPEWIPGDAFRILAEPFDAVKIHEGLTADQIKSLGLLIDPSDLSNQASVAKESRVRDWLLANGARSVDFVAPSNQSSVVRDKLLKAKGDLYTPDFLIDGYLPVDVKVLRSFKKIEANVIEGAAQANTVVIDYRNVDVEDTKVFQEIRKTALNTGHKVGRIVAIGKESVFFWERESNVR